MLPSLPTVYVSSEDKIETLNDSRRMYNNRIVIPEPLWGLVLPDVKTFCRRTENTFNWTKKSMLRLVAHNILTFGGFNPSALKKIYTGKVFLKGSQNMENKVWSDYISDVFYYVPYTEDIKKFRKVVKMKRMTSVCRKILDGHVEIGPPTSDDTDEVEIKEYSESGSLLNSWPAIEYPRNRREKKNKVEKNKGETAQVKDISLPELVDKFKDETIETDNYIFKEMTEHLPDNKVVRMAEDLMRRESMDYKSALLLPSTCRLQEVKPKEAEERYSKNDKGFKDSMLNLASRIVLSDRLAESMYKKVSAGMKYVKVREILEPAGIETRNSFELLERYMMHNAIVDECNNSKFQVNSDEILSQFQERNKDLEGFFDLVSDRKKRMMEEPDELKDDCTKDVIVVEKPKFKMKDIKILTESLNKNKTKRNYPKRERKKMEIKEKKLNNIKNKSYNCLLEYKLVDKLGMLRSPDQISVNKELILDGNKMTQKDLLKKSERKVLLSSLRSRLGVNLKELNKKTKNKAKNSNKLTDNQYYSNKLGMWGYDLDKIDKNSQYWKKLSESFEMPTGLKGRIECSIISFFPPFYRHLFAKLDKGDADVFKKLCYSI